MPSCRSIADANKDLTDSLGISPLEAEKTCWRCRYLFSTGNPMRAHVQAASQAGSDHPTNFYCLCNRCHSEQPDNAPREYQDKWLRIKPGNNWDEMTATGIVSEEFFNMTQRPISSLFDVMMDEYGTRGMSLRIGSAMKNANQDKAGSGNGIANAIYKLTEIWEQLT